LRCGYFYNGKDLAASIAGITKNNPGSRGVKYQGKTLFGGNRLFINFGVHSLKIFELV
jgi:hypothetical protein